MKEAVLGSFIGLAVGDALGAQVEGLAPGTFEPVTDMGGGGLFRVKPGEYTDDAALALCLAHSLLENGGVFDMNDQIQRYVKWLEEGYMSSRDRAFGIGGTTLKAIQTYRVTGKNVVDADESASGNGGIMRLAPVPLLYRNRDEINVGHYSALSSLVTHGSTTTKDAASYFGLLIWHALKGESKEAIFSNTMELPATNPRLLEVINGSYLRKSPYKIIKESMGYHGDHEMIYETPEIRGTGYVVDTLEAALWAFATFDTFKEGMLALVNIGDDADSTAAVYGQLAGAFYGVSAIPDEWINTLVNKDLIIDTATKLYEMGKAI